MRKDRSTWTILALLFLANFFNFFDRAIPAILVEPIRRDWGLSDFEMGVGVSIFTVVYAIAGVPLGRLADTMARKNILGLGLGAWSLLTAANGLVWNYGSFLAVRLGIGIGEASCAPAAHSMIGDLFPASRRARAVGIFMLGLPLGLILAYFSTGLIVETFGSWRAPFFFAAVPGLVVAALMFFIKEPVRGASEVLVRQYSRSPRQSRSILKISTMRFIILSGVTHTFVSYTATGFLVPLFQRYFNSSLTQAAFLSGWVVAVPGIVSLTAGAWMADHIHQKSVNGRLQFGAGCCMFSGIVSLIALLYGANIFVFTILFGVSFLAFYVYHPAVYPAIQDVVEPNLRGSAMAIYFAAMYLLGGALGPSIVGALSDYLSRNAALAAGTPALIEQYKGIGLHGALLVIPFVTILSGVFILIAARSFVRDAQAMQDRMHADSVEIPENARGALAGV